MILLSWLTLPRFINVQAVGKKPLGCFAALALYAPNLRSNAISNPTSKPFGDDSPKSISPDLPDVLSVPHPLDVDPFLSDLEVAFVACCCFVPLVVVVDCLPKQAHDPFVAVG